MAQDLLRKGLSLQCIRSAATAGWAKPAYPF